MNSLKPIQNFTTQAFYSITRFTAFFMKKIINSLKSLALLALILGVTVACGEEFTNIESDIQGIKNFNTESLKFPVVSYTQEMTPAVGSGIQSNGLPSNLLGVYVDPNLEFGTSTASVVTQLLPTNFDPDFGTNPVFESAVLTIPYFSTLIETDENGESTYALDSIFGNPAATYNLRVYQSNYLLRDLDPTSNFEDAQAYFTSQDADFCSNIGDLLYEELNFSPSDEEIVIYELNPDTNELEVTERLAPALRLDLLNPNNSFWQDLLFANQDMPVLSNANNFTEFFRGLIIKVEQVGADGNITVLDFANSSAHVLIDYINDEEIAAGEEDIRNQTAFRFNFNGIRANTLDNPMALPVGLGDTAAGDDNLYLKGGDGAMAVLNLFEGELLDNNGDPILDENDQPVNTLDYFVSKKDAWLINEVNLIVYVDQSMVNGDEPDRLMLYDLETNAPILDYLSDVTANTADPHNSRIEYSEILERDVDGNGVKYKFRLTQHINNILLGLTTDVNLGLYVAANVNILQNSKVENMVEDDDDSTIDQVPASSLLSHKGTILHGSKATLPVGQRLEFEIFYTEPEN